jgi:hypothetical protein
MMRLSKDNLARSAEKRLFEQPQYKISGSKAAKDFLCKPGFKNKQSFL